MAEQRSGLAVLISGRGSNLIALHQACRAGEIDSTITQVICNNPNAPGLAYCREHSIPAQIIDHRDFPDRLGFDRALMKALDAADVQLILLAGFMRLFSAELTRHFESRMLNIHPSLLPRYRGLNTHQRVLDDGTRWHGCSVHYVTADLDSGPIVARSAIRVSENQSSDELAAALLEREHRLYPFAVRECINGNIQLREGQVLYRNKPLPYPLLV